MSLQIAEDAVPALVGLVAVALAAAASVALVYAILRFLALFAANG